MTLRSSIADIRKHIEKASIDSPLAGGPVTLLAASKGQPATVIREAIEAGVSDFGENRVQEAEEKWPALKKDYPHVRLHLIGPLQSNKAKEALGLFDVIQTVDRIKLVDAIADALAKMPGKKPACYIQVNTGKEDQKAGVLPEEADALIDNAKTRLPLVGLMCIPPVAQPPAPHFAFLRALAISHGLPELSMGMSDDFETAVRMGATCVRLGRALFGERG